ncbi:guanine-nucleotide dissociation stimulator CDC25 [Aureobasidium pullulans]|uniref:Class E vacuolar protein-sorting machinery protein HSE1 n=1 Tax=Aureobasidium pullulans TaxID=5580 RepID=A0A4S8WGI3_AURPU|nr:guanine-nucleotide dissociation stimulator CDC25 [Aureobasidium pullulans]THW24061.1 guanine-nucleotide dissociation stimulator CDC25 [Aureobasidium pullulans]THW51587.1 guanine-nucleotide dissociation stimulator CDC25 [Aureobasidium pullulans]
MNGLASSPMGTMYVRALYDYDADDRTSLSFRQGDIIQVITQLESGWWDGIIRGVRGWFPSNYCELIAQPQDVAPLPAHLSDPHAHSHTHLDDTASESSYRHVDSAPDTQEEAAFWIPQATPDGRLFYFNTLTGVSTMELPLENPTMQSEPGPHDKYHVLQPDQSRPPPEMLARGYERAESEADYESASEADMTRSRTSLRNRGSYVSNALSPATSSESLRNSSPLTRSRTNVADMSNSAYLNQANMPNMPNGIGMTSFINSPMTPAQKDGLAISRRCFDDSQTVLLTWNTLVEDMRRAVQRYRESIDNSYKGEFVKRAEDISDHLRLLLAAGSGTTDNHSGNPSIISTNKALYPHFREMMSSFSKLVLSSHFAAADFTTPDSYSKCLQEAEGLLHGVYGYVEVARQQRGEEIPRLTPGFVSGIRSGASWQNNGLVLGDPSAASQPFLQQDTDTLIEPSARLDQTLLERMDDMRKNVSISIRRLDKHLAFDDKLVTPKKHKKASQLISQDATRVIEACRPYFAVVESINLAPLGSTFKNPQIIDFSTQKQKFYDNASELVLACQTIASPLSDEWSDHRGSSLEERITHVKIVSRELDNSSSQLQFSLQLLAEMMPQDSAAMPSEDHHNTNNSYPEEPRGSSTLRGKPNGLGPAKSFVDGPEPTVETPRLADNSKLKRFFGEMPAPIQQEDVPDFLKLDHEGEIAYDNKVHPAQLRGGTLTGLVEQLTRHDRLDSPFNNTFLLTYRSFTSASELFEMLVKRWNVQPPYGLNPHDLETWVNKKQKPIRFRVVNILKSWFDNYWMEENSEVNQQLMQRVYSFAKETVASGSTPGAGPLMTAIEQRMRGQDAPGKRLVLTLNSEKTPTPIIPKNIKKLKFLDIDALEFARQLTIIESRLYCKIKPTECLNKTWQKKLQPNEPDPAANVKALILHSNQLTNWVAQMILTQADVKRRVIVIKHFVAVADKCRQLNNFSTLTSIISALGTAPIHRLGRTWAQVNQKTQAVLEVMRKLMGSTKNFSDYRETLHKANPPCIPFFGVYLTDLTFIEDGIPSVIKKTNLINFAKRSKTAEVIRDIQQYQNVPYPLQPVPELQDYILTNMQTAGDVHEMYDRSLAVEPREREDEKIARLLSESGFL